MKKIKKFKHLEKLKSQWFRDLNSPHQIQFSGNKETQPAIKEFHCNTCSKPFSNEEALEVHEKVHDFGKYSQPTVKKFHCNTSYRPFNSEEALKVHEKDHNWGKNSRPTDIESNVRTLDVVQMLQQKSHLNSLS